VKSYLISALLLCLSVSELAGGSEYKANRQIEKATNVLNEIMNAPDKSIPRNLLDKAVCVGIVPSELRFAIGFGGTYGRGMLVCRRNGNGPWGGPSLFFLGGGNFGFQLGGRATDVVFLVMNASGARKLLSSRVKIGVDASAAAGPVGREAAAATDVQLQAEILTYSRSRGLFAGVSLAGAVLKQDVKGNKTLYGREVSPKDILINGTVPPPAAARELDHVLTRYSPRGGQPFSI
jgi:lipid-binding SYLF domain-containing protein